MQRISYEEVNSNDYRVEKEAKFISEDIIGFKTYEEVYNKFKDFRFDEQFINEIKDEFECQIYSYIVFTIYFDDIYQNLFCAEMEIPNRNEIIYKIHPPSNCIETKTIINDFLQSRFIKKVWVQARINITFHVLNGLDMYERYQEESEEDEEENLEDEDEPKQIQIEKPFISDNCSICLEAKPNILYLPCRHLAVCSSCEEAWPLINCSVCRKTIQRKIKI